MNRREGLAILATLCAHAPLSAAAQTSQTARRIAYLGSVTTETDKDRFAEFRRELRRLGYVEGRNLIIDSRHEVEVARLAPLANELLGQGPNVFVTIATPATTAAKNATRQVPIVFAGVGDPIALGLVTSLSRPGGNVTGVANIVSDLAGKRLEMLKELLPGLALVGVLLEPQTAVSVLQWEASERAARGIDLRLHSTGGSGRPMRTRLRSPKRRRPEWRPSRRRCPPSPVPIRRASRALQPSTDMPSIYARTQFVEDGGLMSYGAGQYSRRSSDGALGAPDLRWCSAGRPSGRTAGGIRAVLNMKTARQLGLTIPKSLLLRADRLID